MEIYINKDGVEFEVYEGEIDLPEGTTREQPPTGCKMVWMRQKPKHISLADTYWEACQRNGIEPSANTMQELRNLDARFLRILGV